MIEAALVGSVQTVDTEVEVENALSSHPGLFDGFRGKFGFFFLEPEKDKFVIFSH